MNFLIVSLLLVAAPATMLNANAGQGAGQDQVVTDRAYDADGRLIYETGYQRYNSGIGFVTHYFRLGSDDDRGHNPNHGGDVSTSNDCTSDRFKDNGYFWTEAYSAKVDSHASIFSTSAETWDVETGTDIFGSIQLGNDGTAGVQDFKNNIQFVDMGESTTIAVTTTWFFRSTGEAVESDQQYNTFYEWSTSGEPDKMDVQNIATHELGHTFGLGHPNGPPSISCLTMYAFADFGETQKRTLGVGDILGIEDIYGA